MSREIRQKIRVTVDIVILTIAGERLKVLLVKRGIAPFQGHYALPGGFVHQSESLEDAARRELSEETGTRNVYLEQLYSFGDPDRDPRGRVLTVAYYALVPAGGSPLKAGSDAAEADWFPVAELPKLAFDHRQIIEYAIERIRNKLEYTTVGFELLPEKFTLSALQRLYEIILDKELDKRNFRRKIDALGLLKPLKEMQATGRRPAQLFRFAKAEKRGNG
jgi:8-oxo-dGTP diphosphatase